MQLTGYASLDAITARVVPEFGQFNVHLAASCAHDTTKSRSVGGFRLQDVTGYLLIDVSFDLVETVERELDSG